MQAESYIRPVDVDYHDGERYPVLVRDDSQKDYLDEITKPLVPTVSAGIVTDTNK